MLENTNETPVWMLPPGKAAIVYHAEAGRGQASALVEPTRRRLKSAGWRVAAIEPTRRADHARRTLAPYVAERADLVVVISGDGTLRELCAGLRDVASCLPIGFVPTGNANVVAREQAIPLNPVAAIALLTRGVPRRLDMGWLRFQPPGGNGKTTPEWSRTRPFLSMVEIGLGAEVVRRAHHLRSGRLKSFYRRWGDPIYLTAAMAALLSSEESPFQILQESGAAFQAVAAVVANTRCYAKGWTMAPDARMDDGRLDMVARRRSGPGSYMRALHAAALKRHPPMAISRCCRGGRFVCQSDLPMAVQVDGDPLPSTRYLEIGLSPGSMRLIVPAIPSEDAKRSMVP